MRLSYLLPVVLVICIGGCSKNETDIEMKSVDPGVSVIDSIKGKRVFFGHQSVGGNVIDGISSINKKSGGHLSIKEGKDTFESDITHAYIGKNEQPITKITEFENIIHENASAIDIAYMKFCYIDINEDTDIDLLFDSYVSRMSALEHQYPSIKFIKSTAPIRVINNSLIAKTKRLLGKDLWGDKDAVKRNEFNKKIRAKYSSKELFDIAKLESNIGQDTNKVKTNYGDQESLIPGLSSDGGHLNAFGSEYVAAEFIQFVSALN